MAFQLGAGIGRRRERGASAVIFGLPGELTDVSEAAARTQALKKLSFTLAPIDEGDEPNRPKRIDLASGSFGPPKPPIADPFGARANGPARGALKLSPPPPSKLVAAPLRLEPKASEEGEEDEEGAGVGQAAYVARKTADLPSAFRETCEISFGDGVTYEGGGKTYLVYLHPHGDGSLRWHCAVFKQGVAFTPFTPWDFGACEPHGVLALKDGSRYEGAVRGPGVPSPQLSWNQTLRQPSKPAPRVMARARPPTSQQVISPSPLGELGACCLNGRAQVMADGHGTMTYANGDVYVGRWVGSRHEGEGTLTEADGAVYAGTWNLGLRSGAAVHTDVGGGVHEGWWEGDAPKEGRKV
jgi:hypothetical protein